MESINKVAVLGAGVIGASWSALFLAAGHEVAVYDPLLPGRPFVGSAVGHAESPSQDSMA